jgi:cell wall-associated NlpC family hydrolase
MNRFTRRCLAPVFVLLAISIARAQTPAVSATSPEEAIQAVRARVAPDKRLVLFDVSVDRTGEALALVGEVESAAARDAALDAVRRLSEVPVTDRIVLLPHTSLGTETAGIVRVSVANVRGTPAHGGEMVTQALMGWPVRVLKRQGGWNLVHTEPDGYLGWVEDLQLARVTPRDRDAWQSASRVIVTASYTIARSAADADSEAVTDLVVGNIAKTVAARGEWREVALPDSRRAFVRASDIEDYAAWSTSRGQAAEAIARTAARFIGVPYLWGGTSAKGFDCSGFAKTVMYLHGIELPRDTDQQARMGAAVPMDEGLTELRTGDLLFFGTAATADRPERVSHVGVYVGNGEFIHASGLVRRNSVDPTSLLYDAGLRKRLLHVRRVFTS